MYEYGKISIMKLRIFFDLDNTINDLCRAWFAAIEKQTGFSIPKDRITQWNLHECITEIAAEHLYSPLDIGSTYLNAQPIAPYAVLEELFNTYDCYIATAITLPATFVAKCTWLSLYYPFIHRDRIIAINHKNCLNGNILIDDGLHNIETFQGLGIIFNQPWNTANTTHIRAYNWQDVRTEIRNHDNTRQSTRT